MLQDMLADLFSNKAAIFSILGISSFLSGASVLANYMDLKITINREKEKKKSAKKTVADEGKAEAHQTEKGQTGDVQTTDVEESDDHSNDVEVNNAQISDSQVNGMQLSSAKMVEMQETMPQSKEIFDSLMRENEKLRRMLLIYQVQAVKEKEILERLENLLKVQDIFSDHGESLFYKKALIRAMVEYCNKDGIIMVHNESAILPKHIKAYKKMLYKRPPNANWVLVRFDRTEDIGISKYAAIVRKENTEGINYDIRA